MCGGADGAGAVLQNLQGLSPRVRGSRLGQDRVGLAHGSIPACAGEPEFRRWYCDDDQVYPRVCGGALGKDAAGFAKAGLSPRVRGSQLADSPSARRGGSIPACAGEPVRGWKCQVVREVYPRVCGGADKLRPEVIALEGLSPRVRGSQLRVAGVGGLSGSIPACAGEPRMSRWATTANWVYPRVCGGARDGERTEHAGPGLSPRVRGSHQKVRCPLVGTGSIPACAGEPSPVSQTPGSARVYPRVCGGAAARVTVKATTQGLSPRVRGSLVDFFHANVNQGSIPACAGEPQSARSRSRTRRVYPRVCGGAASRRRTSACSRGLSPRVRGSLNDLNKRGRDVGSIPACAGEPPSGVHRRGLLWVYPRVCGGAVEDAGIRVGGSGLSPRVRGSHHLVVHNLSHVRSIPACAGEPLAPTFCKTSSEVYPRVCGGA